MAETAGTQQEWNRGDPVDFDVGSLHYKGTIEEVRGDSAQVQVFEQDGQPRLVSMLVSTEKLNQVSSSEKDDTFHEGRVE